VPPILEIEANQSGSFSYRDADGLFERLMVESLNRVGEMMVFDLVTMAQEYMAGERRRVKGSVVEGRVCGKGECEERGV
jgi:hypothetical protein